MSAFQIPPLVIFSLADSGIARPTDLVGKKVGVTTDYWKDVLEQTLKGSGIKPSRVKAVHTEAEDLQALYDHEVDAWLGYAQDEPIQAEVAGYEVKDVYPADYGVGGYEGLVLTDEKTVAADPELVRRFVAASQRGWRYAVEHPDEAARILLKWAPDRGLEFQQLAVQAVAPLVDTPQVPIGWIDAARWRKLMGSGFDAARPGYTMKFSATQP
jgi:ABC-type nitrate/sulfonate/bicarbonate transport system substrate-binding protein